jgi:hypothetical protein
MLKKSSRDKNRIKTSVESVSKSGASLRACADSKPESDRL